MDTLATYEPDTISDVATLPLERITQAIFTIRGTQIILDSDLAGLYEVPTKALNQAVKRNANRFPDDFIFRLTSEETRELVTNCDRFDNLKHSSITPLAFTEHGAMAAAFVLHSQIAVKVSAQVIRAFIRMRSFLASTAPLESLACRIDTLENRADKTEVSLQRVFDSLEDLRGKSSPSLIVHGPMVGNVVGLGSQVNSESQLPMEDLIRLIRVTPWEMDDSGRKELEDRLAVLESKPTPSLMKAALAGLCDTLAKTAGGVLGDLAKGWLMGGKLV